MKRRRARRSDFFASKLPWCGGKGKKGIFWRSRRIRKPNELDNPRMIQISSFSSPVKKSSTKEA